MTTHFDDSSFPIHRKHKPAQQYASDVRSIWMVVDPITSNHPNALTHDELIGERFLHSTNRSFNGKQTQ